MSSTAINVNDIAVYRDTPASDDVAGAIVASAAVSSAAAGATGETCAEVDAALAPGKRSGSSGASRKPNGSAGSDVREPESHSQPGSHSQKDSEDRRNIPPGRKPLPMDGPAFVDEVHKRMDLIKLQVDLLHSKDDKLVQRELDYLLDLKYGKDARRDDDEPRVSVNIEQPEREPS